MSEIVERVARAIEAVDRSLWVGENRKAYFESAARAAIEAMRGPTEAMLDAATPDMSNGEKLWIWQAMIDEALK